MWRHERGIDAPLPASSGWVFVANRVVDAAFLLDVAVRCNTAFFDERANALNEDHLDIVRRYWSSGAMVVDLLALLPLDLVTHPARTSLLVVVLRVLRLLKLGRIRTLARLDTLLLDGVRARSGHLRLARFLAMSCLLSHLMACGLHLVAAFQRGQGTCTWIDYYYQARARGGGARRVGRVRHSLHG